VDLPTYTNIWRIEKRLYKLYDFRLPAPLPINWIAVFTGITVPYIVLLVAIGLPFNHTLVWLYILPPGLLTWLTTRPVIESKRLPELLESQIRYLTEPRVWCRLAPLSEKDQIIVTARVWHSRRAPRKRKEQGVVAVRERGTMARRNRRTAQAGAAVEFDNAVSAASAATPVAAASAPSPAPSSARLRARARGKGTGASRTPVKTRSAEPRPARGGPAAAARPAAETWPAPEPPAAAEPWQVSDRGTAAGPWPASDPGPGPWPVIEPGPPRSAGEPRSVAGPHRAPPRAPVAGQEAAPKHGRFRLSALRSRPAGPAPALPPGVTLKPPASGERALPVAGRPRSEAAPGLGPVVAPFASDLPEHAAPEVSPLQAPVRERPGGAGAPPIEVSHSGQPSDLFAVSGARTPPSPNKSPELPPKGDAAAEVVTPPADEVPEVVTPPEADVAAEKVARVTAVARNDERILSIERALGGPAKDRNLSWHGKVRIVAGATAGPGARDQEALDRARARLPLNAPKRVLMLGCTSGAGQTVTTLMTGHIMASLREQPVAVVDLHDGTLARYSSPVGWMEEILGGKTPEIRASSPPDGLNPNSRDTAARLDVIASHESLRDGDERLLAEHLGRYYPLAMLDPGATGLTKLLTITDQLVVVAPASVEAPGALADTRDWLDAHGFADLAAHSVTLINGVSKRSMADVAQAESVARGRCRAIVRVPWDDMLPVGVTGPSTLRPQTRVAYTALAGVLVAGMAATPIRKKN
jgi:TcpE family